MNQEQKSGYSMQIANSKPSSTQYETSTDSLSVLRLQVTYRLVLTGVLALVSVIVFIIILVWLLPGGLPNVVALAFAIAAIGVIGTLVGTAVGHLLGAMGKEQADKRADKNLALLLEHLQKSDEPGSSSHR